MLEGESIRGTLAPEQQRARLTERLIVVGAVMGLATMMLYLALYFSTGIWQIGVSAGALAVTLVCLVLAWLLARRQEVEWSAVLVLAAVMIAFGGGEMAWSGATVYNLISVTLLIGLVGSTFIPRRWWLWLAAIALYGAWTLFVLLVQPMSRYDVGLSPILRLYVPAASAAIVLATAVQVARAFRIGTIRTRLLIAFGAIALMVAAIISVTSAVLTWQNGQRQVLDQLGSTATLKEREIQAWLDTLTSDMTILLSTQPTTEQTQAILQGAPDSREYQYAHEQLVKRFQAYQEQTGRFQEIYVLDSQGRVVLSTDPSREGQLEAGQPYFRGGLAGLYVSSPSYVLAFGGATMVLAQPLTDSTGRANGVLAGRPTMEVLNAALAVRSGLGQTGETYLVGLDHSLVTPSWGTPRITGQEVRVNTVGAERAVGALESGSGLYDNYRGIPVLGVYRWLPSLGVAMLAEQEQSETLSTVRTGLLTNLAVAAGAVLAALGAAMLVTRSIAGPLSRLAETSGQIAAGKLALSAEVERDDEIGTVARGFNRMTSQLRDLIGALEQRVADRTAALEQRSNYLQASAEVGQAAASILDTESLIKQVVELIRDRFGLYYVGLFLVDESGEWAVLHSGTGDAGLALLARGHRRRLGEGMIGWSVEHGEARIALDVGQDAVRLGTPELPETRSEAALPLRSRGRVLGALTVQSEEPAAFDQDSLVVLQTMAEQVAVALDNARLFAESQHALDAAGRAYGETSLQGWAEMVRARPDLAFRSDERGVTPATQIWGLEMERAMETGRSVQGPLGESGIRDESLSVPGAPAPEPLYPGAHLSRGTVSEGEQSGQEQAERALPGERSNRIPLAVPIKVRGEVIGVLDTYHPSEEGAWSAQEVALLEAIADQLGTALESARLYHTTQRRAVQERLIGKVTARMRETLDVEAVVKTAADEIYKVLELDEVVVRLVPPSEGDGRDRRQPVQPSGDSDLMRRPAGASGTGEEEGR